MVEHEPILDRSLVVRAERALAALWRGLEGPIAIEPHSWMTPEWARATLSDGLPGPAIAMGHRALAHGDERIADRCRGLLVEAVDAGKALWIAPGLVQGVAGLGYAIEHLAAIELVEGVEQVADTLAGRACEAIAPGGLTHDLFFGTAGMVVYGLERARASNQRDVLGAALEHVAARATRDPNGITWIQVADTRWMDPAMVAKYPDGHIDTGMSHGVAGVIAALAAAIRAGADGEIQDLARGALAWLWSVMFEGNERLWPTVVGEPGGGSGWCRGDLGVAAAACAAAFAVGDHESIARATAAARTALERRDWVNSTVALCHGPAGAAHVAHRLYRLTGDPSFADAARSACADVLDQLDRHELGPGIVTGRSGVALALESLVGTIEPSWDRWFLPGFPSDR